VLPVATGLKTARPELTVLAVGGDGDAYSIGAGHIPHIARRNPVLVYIVMDNEVYGLTKGQSSATGENVIAGTTPYGTMEEALNPLAVAIGYNISFVARGYSGKPKELAELIGQAMDHKGFALLEVLSPCTTFHDTYKPISQAIRFIGPEHDPADRKKAFELSLAKDYIPLGIFYKSERSTFEERSRSIQDAAREKDPSELAALVDRFV
jgi:2-oxoglutarate ferredoxin oxidoreductase subunit beta